MSDTPLLSILVITHNQKTLFQRCIESVLSQDIPFKYEIIISDDRSTDGTWELIEDYVEKYNGLIKGYNCNSNDCNPINKSERSGWNRCNAYNHANGKYIVHIDGDDYLLGKDCYRKQVEMLELNPGCSMCMQNVLFLIDGLELKDGHPIHSLHKFHDGQIITPKEFFLNHYFIFHSAFVFRRQININPVKIYGKYYVDDIITFHHLQFGPIVCVDCCDYVYIKYPHSITSSLNPNERAVIWTLDLTVFCSMQIPTFTGLYYAGNLRELYFNVNRISQGLKFSEETKLNFKQNRAFIYQVCVKDSKSFMDIITLNLIKLILFCIIKARLSSSIFFIILHKLLVGGKVDERCNFNIK